MSFNSDAIDAAAEIILLKIKKGELGEACCMSAVNPQIREHLKSASFDDFDLNYERLLQIISLDY